MTISDLIHDDTICLLGEGPLWHPERGELFWFDILGRTLHRRGQHWRFDDIPTAAGWVDRDTLLIATERAFVRFDLRDGSQTPVADLDADNPTTRSNDGRADPQGGFWIGTMGKRAEKEAGAIWRFYRGEVRKLYPRITIPNAICFAPDGRTAFWTDTETQMILRQPLDADGWPKGTPELHIDLRGTDHWPDGAVVDADGRLWNAQWGSSRVACYDPEGDFLHAVDFPALQTSCPAFGGEGLSTLFCTSAAAGLAQADIAFGPENGRTFGTRVAARGQAEHRVIL